jgi:oxygen-independent coproporphyrinogen-3 oxidase
MNRVSVGAQSFQPRHLKFLERWHDPAHVARAVGIARGAGIANINLDLIFAIPGQSAEDWLADIEETLALEPSHISCYALTYEPGTPLSKRATQGLQPCDEQAEAGMYGSAIDRLQAAGFRQYEISNFALPDFECLHNLLYWENENWLAFGPGAAGHLNGVRWKNAPDLERYLASSGGAPIQDVELLDADASLGEQLMLRLRLTNGVPLDWLEPRLDPRRGQIIERHLAMGLLERTPTHLRLTRHGMLVANRIVEELL